MTSKAGDIKIAYNIFESLAFRNFFKILIFFPEYPEIESRFDRKYFSFIL